MVAVLFPYKEILKPCYTSTFVEYNLINYFKIRTFNFDCTKLSVGDGSQIKRYLLLKCSDSLFNIIKVFLINLIYPLIILHI
jgi:hypothetical protein